MFFPQVALDQWLVDGKIDLSSTELILLAEGRRYKVEEAVRVLVEVTGANDAHKLVGKVKPKSKLEEIGAEILENSMIVGDNAYDVVPGFCGVPAEPWSDHARSAAPGAPASEEDMLRRFAEGTP